MNPSKNENTLDPHPDPSVKCVKTQVAGCLSGVNHNSTKQIQKVAATVWSVRSQCPRVGGILLIGANQRIIRCNAFVVMEQITPNTQSNITDKSTVSDADLNLSAE